MKDIRAVLFDAGGTLIHVDGERVCRAAGIDFDAAAFRTAEGEAVAAVRRLVLERPESRDAERIPLYMTTLVRELGLDAEDACREAAGRIAAEHGRANLWSRAADDAAETLSGLRTRGYRVAVISNADGRVRRLLEVAGLAPHLEFVVDSAEVGLEKPDPRIFHAATDRLALPPEACAYVGDIYEIDVVGAERAGLSAILVGDGPAPESVRRVARLAELHPLFPGFA
ncbi:MAG TPA: HAD-IA family hydrolase [Thermoanaerobaculia bacterium]|nr:HAD-IA family hydrolase [Thermoanaerobaculia bacterium]